MACAKSSSALILKQILHPVPRLEVSHLHVAPIVPFVSDLVQIGSVRSAYSLALWHSFDTQVLTGFLQDIFVHHISSIRCPSC